MYIGIQQTGRDPTTQKIATVLVLIIIDYIFKVIRNYPLRKD